MLQFAAGAKFCACECHDMITTIHRSTGDKRFRIRSTSAGRACRVCVLKGVSFEAKHPTERYQQGDMMRVEILNTKVPTLKHSDRSWAHSSLTWLSIFI